MTSAEPPVQRYLLYRTYINSLTTNGTKRGNAHRLDVYALTYAYRNLAIHNTEHELEDGTHISTLKELTTAPDEKRNQNKMVLYLGTYKHVPSGGTTI